MKPYIITALDIGSSYIKIATVSQKPGEDGFKVLSQNSIPSLGIRRGVVINIPKVTEAISSLIRKNEEESGHRIKNILANIGGSHIFSTSSKGLVSVSRADKEISEEDVERVLRAAQTFPLSGNNEVFQVFPKEFIVDGEGKVKKAVGMKGVRLEANVLALCIFSPYLRNSTQAILDSGLEIDNLIVTPLASSRAVLTDEEKELGVCLLDIGAKITGMAIFEEGDLIHTAFFPVGSGNITNDIAICLQTDISTAEKIKLEFGTCKGVSKKKSKRSLSRQGYGPGRKIKIDPSLLAEGDRVGGEEPLIFTKKMLEDIIEARVSDIFDFVNRELKKISRKGNLPAGVVLTGGGSKLPGIKETVKKKLKLPCRIGSIKESPFQEDPTLSVLWGLILEGIDIKDEESGSFGFWKRIKDGCKKVGRIFKP